MKNIKNIILYISFATLIISCSKEKEVKVVEEDYKEGEIDLTEEIIKVNGIKFGKIEKRSINSKIIVNGIIHALPQNKSSIHSQVDGFLESLKFVSGEYVKKGQVLATIKNPAFITLQKQFLDSYFKMDVAFKDFKRKETLLEEDAISRKDYEQAQSNYQVTRAEYESWKSELNILGFNSQNIEKTRKITPILSILSPRSGFIEAKEISPGTQITISDELFVVIDQSVLNVELNVPSKYASSVYIGQNLEFKLPEIKETLTGKVSLIGKVTNVSNNTIQIHGIIDSKLPEANFYEGRAINAVIISKAEEVSTLPKEAVFEEESKTYIFVKHGNHVQKQEVKIGAENNEYIEILDLKTNEEIVISGTYYLKAREMESGHSH